MLAHSNFILLIMTCYTHRDLGVKGDMHDDLNTCACKSGFAKVTVDYTKDQTSQVYMAMTYKSDYVCEFGLVALA